MEALGALAAVDTVVSLVNTCSSAGEACMRLWNDFKHFKEDLKDSQLLYRAIWEVTKDRMDYVRKTIKSQRDLLEIHIDFFRKLKQLLKSIKKSLESLREPNLGTKLKWITHVKGKIGKDLVSLRTWRDDWGAVFRLRYVEEEVKKPQGSLNHGTGDVDKNLLVALQNQRPTADQIPPRSCSHRLVGLTAAVAWSESNRSWRLVDTMTVSGAEKAEDKRKTVTWFCYLMSVASQANANLLKTEAFSLLKSKDVSGFHIYYEIPSKYEWPPESLRGFLLRGKSACELQERLDIAKQLARTIIFLHTIRVVHKNIRPEAIVLCRHSSKRSYHPFLVGFDSFRPTEMVSLGMSDADWKKNLYRHPDRQGEFPDSRFQLQHDIYSFGACLLELGLATSFVRYDKRGRAVPTVFGLRTGGSAQKTRLLSLAEKDLPLQMGRSYTEVVKWCLHCAENMPENSGGSRAEKKLAEDFLRNVVQKFSTLEF